MMNNYRMIQFLSIVLVSYEVKKFRKAVRDFIFHREPNTYLTQIHQLNKRVQVFKLFTNFVLSLYPEKTESTIRVKRQISFRDPGFKKHGTSEMWTSGLGSSLTIGLLVSFVYLIFNLKNLKEQSSLCSLFTFVVQG